MSSDTSREFMFALITKYVLGSADLILTPLIICLMDSEIRQGIFFLFRWVKNVYVREGFKKKKKMV